MPKLKTKSAIKKRFIQKVNGTIVARCSKKRHNTGKKPHQLNKSKTGLQEISSSDVKLVMRCAPYGIRRK